MPEVPPTPMILCLDLCGHKVSAHLRDWLAAQPRWIHIERAEDDPPVAGFDGRTVIRGARPGNNGGRVLVDLAEPEVLLEALRGSPVETLEEAAACARTHAGALLEQGADEQAEVWAVAGLNCFVPFVAEHPAVDVVLAHPEAADAGELQSSVASARGEARRAGKRWGISLTTWWPPAFGRMTGVSGSMFESQILVAWMGGAAVVRLEGAGQLLEPGKEGFSPLALGIQAVVEVVESTLRGVPEVTVAVLLPRRDGWIPPSYARPGGTAPWGLHQFHPSQSHAAIDRFACTVFPGIEYANDPFPFGGFQPEGPPSRSVSTIHPAGEGPGLFKDRDEARDYIGQYETPMELYRPQATTRFGSTFDFITVEPGKELRLAGYRGFVLVGSHDLDARQIAALRAAVQSGARGVACPLNDLNVFFDEPVVRYEYQVAAGWTTSDDDAFHECLRVLTFMGVGPLEREALVPASTVDEDYLVIEKSSGKGAWVVCGSPGYGSRQLASAVVRHLVTPFQRCWLGGHPAAYQLMRHDDAQACTVLVCNHTGYDRELKLTFVPAWGLKKPKRGYRLVPIDDEEMVVDSRTEGKFVHFAIDLIEFEFGIYRFEPKPG